MSKDQHELPVRFEVVGRLMEGAKNGMIVAMAGEAFSAAEAVSAALTLTASVAEALLALSTTDGYGHNLNQILLGIKQLEARVNPPGVKN